MATLWVVGRRRPDLRPSGRHRDAALQAAGAAMEGKEVRFGDAASALFAASTTMTSTGAVNSIHDSLHRAGRRRRDPGHAARRGGARRRRRGPVRDAGAGHRRGVRRRPDGRADAGVPRQEDPAARRSSSSRSYILTMPAVVLIGTAIAMSTAGGGPVDAATPARTGCPRSLYAFASAGQQQRLRVRGPDRGNTVCYNTLLGLAMLVGRFVPIALVAGAGRLARPPAEGARDRRHAADAHARCSSASWSA